MATETDEPTAAPATVSHADSAANSSDSDSDSADAPETPIEWLATGRAKRSTAGNRMKSMLAAETPADEDSDLELLFQEDEDDVGFSEKENDDGSDAAMESSDDEDENEVHDDDAGEKELERQAKEKRTAARKRKAQEAIPAKFRKKVRIHPPDASSVSTAAAPPPRPKKKSERASWLPTEAEMPTRASGRKTTQLSKEQLHQQMIEREARRLKQVELMERQAKKKEAMKKPPMTQAERLKEATVVEKRNAKSLNRWEEAEKQREEERRAKLAALNDRRLEGPVVTFWTGIIDLSEVQLKHVGKMVSMEEKPKRKRPSTAAGKDSTPIPDPKTENGSPATTQATPMTQDTPALPVRPETPAELETSNAEPSPITQLQVATSSSAPASMPTPSVLPSTEVAPFTPATAPPAKPTIPFKSTTPFTVPPFSPVATYVSDVPAPSIAAQQSSTSAPPVSLPQVKTDPQSLKSVPLALRPDTGPRFMPPPNPHFASSARPSPSIPPAVVASGPTAASVGFAPVPVAQAPGSAQSQSPLVPPHIRPLSMFPSPTSPNPPTSFQSPFPPPNLQSTMHTTASFQPILPTTPSVKFVKKHQPEQMNTRKSAGKAPVVRKAVAPTEPPAPDPPMEGKVTRSCIILQDFDADAIKKPEVQTQILFGWKMNKLAKPPPPALCVITNQPARYRDPKTGLPYHNADAFKEIRKLIQGNFHWSKLLGTWVGNGTDAATGVPDRFTHPETEAEHKERLERKKQDETSAKEEMGLAEVAEASKTSEPKTEESVLAPMSGDDVAMTDAPPSSTQVSQEASASTFAEPNLNMAPIPPAGMRPQIIGPALGAATSHQPNQSS